MAYDCTAAMSASQAGRVLGLSSLTVRLMCRAAKLKGERTTLGWLIDPDDVERLRLERAGRNAAEEGVSAD
jgi:cell division inhibitor SulA